MAVINADGLRVRAEASEDSEVKAMLAEGDEVEVLDTGDEDWIEISFEDGTSGEDSGYISGEYVSLKASYKTGETIEEVKEVKRHFYQCPDKIYSTVLASVVGDDGMIAEALRDLKR